ncbi:amino acid adenylation domain-containing protein [Kitasatospora sp. A2-31]|uniref:non-ribosomal peptide synthetase n=1 Tax=Kitasatospora sp. A2-31 TaxID=2916414 RepID=UPI001EEAE2EE|nr:amino acid adenylation domain-containing protein [Kitasatospora sp. A2-31]MCG6498315.1 amino acid adenylation domain-containing protein [Kitasatospora sp. A2-31]
MTAHDPFPLTPLQEAYLVGSSRLVELGGFRPAYYVELDLVNADLARAERALRQLVRRHGHLRTVIDEGGTQRVLPEEQAPPVRLAVTDLGGLDEDARRAALARTRETMCRAGVAPTGRQLFEIRVNRLRPRRVRVHLAMSLLLLDGRGIRQVMDEWRALYHDPDAELPEPGATYRDCRLELLANEDTPGYRDQWRYWEQRLDELPDAPRLPLAVQPAAIAEVRFTRRTHRLTREQWQRLSAAFRHHRVLPTTALCHVFAEVLGAWAEAPHFSLNLLHQNWATTRPHMAGVVGQFGATLPLEVDLRGSDDFWERARLLQRRIWQDLQNADVAGVRITRELAARRGWTSRAALPYVFTSMLKAGGATAPTPVDGRDRLACREVVSDLRTPQVLVDNQLHDGPDGGVDCVWDVVDESFPPGLPELMFRAYGRMLDELAGPDGAAARPDPVPAAHRARIAELNAPAGPAPAERLEDGFLRQAARRPGVIAVLAADRVLSYGELEARSRAVACWLGAQGVGRGEVVPVVMTKGWEQVVAVLGVLRAGAAYCPVDADLPDERIAQLLDGCAATVTLVQSAAEERIGALGPRPLLAVDRAEPDAGRTCARVGDPADLAYVIYTSGSTGQPKGVMVDHAAAVNTVADINRRVGLTPDDRVFGISSLSFDLSVWDVFGTLAAGAALVLPAAGRRPDPLGWAATAVRHGATVWNSVPALAQMLAEVVGQRPEAGVPPVRAFLLSGDWIPTDLPDRLRSIRPAARVIAMGGATEAAIWSNIHEIDRTDPAWRSVPYGVPLTNQTMTVLDHRMELRPPWAVGRIHIGGAGLARGYWQDAARTDERFVRHPRTDERLYTTGDLGCYWPDGTIEFLGREDRQLKIQGFRVEPGEVEAAIRELPAVRDCAVSGEAAAGGQRRLVALAVPREGASLSRQALLDHLRARLPHYLVPARIELLERLPLTPNGKVDVAGALAGLAGPESAPAEAAGAEGYCAEGEGDAGLTGRLQEVWAELLELPAVEPDGDFFALGGNSLLALRLINRIRTELGVELQFGQVFEARTVRALAGRIAAQERAAGCRVTLADGSGAPDGGAPELFLFHPVGGSVSSYPAVARAWAGPVHAFQSRALAEGTTAALETDLVTMATAYREELQQVAPEGPYLLGGWSMGGVLAHEVGRQLAERGHQARVFMIDSDLTEVRPTGSEADGHLEFLADLAGGHLPAAVRTGVLDAPEGTRARAAARLAGDHGWLPEGTDEQQYDLLMRVHAHNLAALGAYRPEKSDVPTLLLVAGAVDRADPVPAWRDLCPGLDVEVWPEDHYSIVAGDRPAAIAERVAAWSADLRPTGR